MALRLRPTDTSFYDLFTTSAQHIVTGAGLLAEMISEGADREDVAAEARSFAHAASLQAVSAKTARLVNERQN